MCDDANEPFYPDSRYKQCDALIPAAEEKVNKDGELTLYCDLQSTEDGLTCRWNLPDGTVCEVLTSKIRGYQEGPDKQNVHVRFAAYLQSGFSH